ncbi:acyltransferase family protein [Streptomyces sp. ME03-5684b]|uniref:acyltransferase family protein n=1 Tax=Streptomyces sp. ME03-5684b TaxID=3028681 RepID=UPI0029B96DF2|nr:acyltransferase family protein [Streptomyces sp. ME03-5684b]MDX3319754.1 acyltransferase family protein [Streptomyces sp. ME03-5684b]
MAAGTRAARTCGGAARRTVRVLVRGQRHRDEHICALGVLRLRDPGRRLPAFLAAPLTWASLACIVLAALRYDEQTPFPGHHALLPVAGTVLVLADGCAPTPNGAGLLLERRPLVWVGGLSYGCYLWHWPFLVVVPAALGRAEGTADVPLALGLSAVALGLAWLTLRLVENPVRFHDGFRGHPRRALALGATLSASASALSLTATAVPPTIEVGGPAPTLTRALSEAADPRARLADLLTSSPAALPSNLAPSLAKVKSSRSAIYRDGCHVNYAATRPRQPCAYGDRTSSRAVVLFGDSRAVQWFPALRRLADARGWKLVSGTKSSCKAADVTVVTGREPYAACYTWRSQAVTAIKALRPALVVVSSSDAGTPARPDADPLHQWTTGFERTFKDLGTSGARVAALLDTPWPKGDPIDCAANNSMQLRACAHRLPAATRDASRGQALRAAASLTGTAVIDPTPWVCSLRTGLCPVVAADTAVHRDGSHLSKAYAEALTPVLALALDRLMM